MTTVIDILSWILLLAGGIFVFVGGIGTLRLPTFYTRMHAASLTDGMGTVLIILGIMLQAGWSLAAAKLLTILVLLLLTGPTASYALANAALLSGMNLEEDEGNGNKAHEDKPHEDKVSDRKISENKLNEVEK